MVEIYHNQKCSKSREGVAFLKDKNVNFKEIYYLETPFTPSQLKVLIQKLGILPMELVRTKEPIWKENFKGKTLTDEQIIEAMCEYPRLIERPIVVNGDKAVIGRPTERIAEVL